MLRDIFSSRTLLATLCATGLTAFAMPERALAQGCAVYSITPAAGPQAGGDQVTIVGRNFRPGSPLNRLHVRFGGTDANDVTVLNSTTIIATTPRQGGGNAPSAVQDGVVTVSVDNGTDAPIMDGNQMPVEQCEDLRDGYRFVAPIEFADDPLIASATGIEAQHVMELRNAIDNARLAANQAVHTWTNPDLTGVGIKATHLLEMRSRLQDALTGHYPVPAFTDPSITNRVPIRAAHIEELRQELKRVGPSCTYTVSPAAFTVSADNQPPASVHVTTGSECDWSVVPATDWVWTDEPHSYRGPGDFILYIGSNPGASDGSERRTTVWVGDQRITITQEAASGGSGDTCPKAISPTFTTFTETGGGGFVDVYASNDCPWGATTEEDWISVSANEAGTGGFTYTVSPNDGGEARAGRIHVGALSMTIIQSGSFIVAPAPEAVNLPSTWRSGSFVLLTEPNRAWTATSSEGWLELVPPSGVGSTTIWYRATENHEAVRRFAEIQFTVGPTTARIAVLQDGTVWHTECGGDFCDDPPIDDCTGGSGGICPYDPWCDGLPQGSKDPHCEPDWCENPRAPRQFRLGGFGDSAICSPPLEGGPLDIGGIFAQGYRVAGISNYFHVGIRIELTESEKRQHPQWASSFVPILFTGFFKATIAGQPSGYCDPTTQNWRDGTLQGRVDRPDDLYPRGLVFEEQLLLAPSVALVDSLFQSNLDYRDRLPYACFPELGDAYYNSNSYAAGLMITTGVRLPHTPSDQPDRFPGWIKPVPTIYFRP